MLRCWTLRREHNKNECSRFKICTYVDAMGQTERPLRRSEFIPAVELRTVVTVWSAARIRGASSEGPLSS